MKADHDAHKTEKRAPPSGKTKTSRLRFSKEESTAPVQTGANAAVMTGAAIIHEQFKADEEENPAVEAMDRTSLTSAGAVRLVHTHAQRGQDASEKSRRISHEEEQRGRMHFEGSGDSPQASAKDSTREKQKKEAVRHQQKKKQVRDGYKASQKRRQQAENAGSALESVMNQLKDAVVEKKHAILIILGLLFMALFLMTQLASCGTMITGAVDAFLETTWLSDDEDFNRADLYYTRLEAELARKVGRSSKLHPGYDEYRFTLDEIGHNPSELVSYLSAEAENGIFEYNAELEDKLDALFAQQYSLLYADRTETTTTSKTVRVGGSIGQVVTSAYCNCAICCGPWAGSPTASGVWPTGNHTLAVDAYAPIVPMGTQIMATVADILAKPEYLGHTVSFRYNTESYKTKKAVKNDPSQWLITENTQEPIVDEETWTLVQKLRKTVRRTDNIGTANPFTGLVYCADCGVKMRNRRRRGKPLKSDPTKLGAGEDTYICKTHDNAENHHSKVCSPHRISTNALKRIVLEVIRTAGSCAIEDEDAFREKILQESQTSQREAAKALEKKLKQDRKRYSELDDLIQSLYESNFSGKISDKRFKMLSNKYEAEQTALEEAISHAESELAQLQTDTANVEKFLELAKQYTDFTELTTPMLNQFVDKILVHEAEKVDGERVQEVEVYLNYIGKFSIPPKVLTEEEQRAAEKEKARRAKIRENCRRYRERKRAMKEENSDTVA